jgi:hypothetical protein
MGREENFLHIIYVSTTDSHDLQIWLTPEESYEL